MEESMRAALRITEFDYHDKSYQKSVFFSNLFHQVSVVENQMHCLATK